MAGRKKGPTKTGFTPTEAGVDAALDATLKNTKLFLQAVEKNPELSSLTKPMANVIEEFRRSSVLGQAAYTQKQERLDSRAKRASDKNVASILGSAPDPKFASKRESASFMEAVDLMGQAFHPSSPLLSRDADPQALSSLHSQFLGLSNNPKLIGTKTAAAMKKAASFAGKELETGLLSSAKSMVGGIGQISVNPQASFFEDIRNIQENFASASSGLAGSRTRAESLFYSLSGRAQDKISGVYSKKSAELNREFKRAIEEKYKRALTSASTREEKASIFTSLKDIHGFEKIGSKGLESMMSESRRTAEAEEKIKYQTEISNIGSAIRSPNTKVSELQALLARLKDRQSSIPEGDPRRAGMASLISKSEIGIERQKVQAQKHAEAEAVGGLRSDYADRGMFSKNNLSQKLEHLEKVSKEADKLRTQMPENKELLGLIRSIAVSTKKTQEAIDNQTNKADRDKAKETLRVEKLAKDYPIASRLAPLLSSEWRDKEKAAGDGGPPFDSKEKKKILQRMRYDGRKVASLAGEVFDSYTKYKQMHVSLPRETAEAQFALSGMQNKATLEAMSFSPNSLIKYAGNYLLPGQTGPFTGREGIARAGLYANEETKRMQGMDQLKFWGDAAKTAAGAVTLGLAGFAAGGPIGAILGASSAAVGLGSSLLDNRYIKSTGLFGNDVANKEKALYASETRQRQLALIDASMQQNMLESSALSTYFENMDRTREVAISVGGGRAISAHAARTGVLASARRSIMGGGLYPMTHEKMEAGVKPRLSDELVRGGSVLEGILSGKYDTSAVPSAPKSRADTLSAPEYRTQSGVSSVLREQMAKQSAVPSPEEAAISEVDRSIASKNQDTATKRAAISGSFEKVRDSEWFYKYGFTPGERSAMAGRVVSSMGAGLGINSSAVQSASDSLTRQLFELGLGGVGSFDQQAANMGRIASTTGRGGQQALNELKKVMSEAFAVGMDNSHTGQKFANVALSLAQSTRTSDVSGMAETLAGVIGALGGKGKDAERVTDILSTGISASRAGLNNPAIDAISLYKLMGKVNPLDIAGLTGMARDPNMIFSSMAELNAMEKGTSKGEGLNPFVKGYVDAYGPKTIKEALLARPQTVLEMISASGGKERIDKAMAAFSRGMKGKGDFKSVIADMSPAISAMQTLGGFESPESALGALALAASSRGIDMDPTRMAELQKAMKQAQAQVQESSSARAARIAAATAASHLITGNFNKTYAQIMADNKAANRDIFQGTFIQDGKYGSISKERVQEIGKAVSERRKITANTSEEQELMKELNTNVLNLSMKKSIEASDFENGGQRVFVTNAMDIGVGMAAVMNNLNQGIGGTVVGSSVKPNGQ